MPQFLELQGPFVLIFHGHGAAAHLMSTAAEVWDYLFTERGANFQEHSTSQQLTDELSDGDNWHLDDAGDWHECWLELGEDSRAQITRLKPVPGQTPFDRAMRIHRGEMDNQMPSYDELKQWMRRVPKTWTPGLLKQCVFVCTGHSVFQSGAMATNVARWEAHAANPVSFLREVEPAT